MHPWNQSFIHLQPLRESPIPAWLQKLITRPILQYQNYYVGPSSITEDASSITEDASSITEDASSITEDTSSITEDAASITLHPNYNNSLVNTLTGISITLALLLLIITVTAILTGIFTLRRRYKRNLNTQQNLSERIDDNTMDTIINSHIIPVNTNESTDTDTNGTTIPLDTNQAYGTTTHLDTNQAYGTTIPLDTNQTYGTTIPLDTNQAYGTTDTNQAYHIVKAEDHVYATLEDEENASHNEDYEYIT